MSQETIMLPVLALALLTFIMLGMVPMRRFRAAFAGQVTPDDFKLGESDKVPAQVSLANRNYMNLLEVPILFYAVAVLFYVTGEVDALAVNLAWAFVALRAAHSAVHVTVNHVITRMSLFALANFVLMALWVVFALRIWDRAA